MKSADYQLKKNEFGFFEIDPKPSKEFLAAFYAEKYFQNDAGNYRAEYSKEELGYFKNRDVQKKIILEETFNLSAKRILDIGCGEGFTLKNFQEFGWEVIGIDFSNFGIRNKNPELLPHFIEGDLLENMTILTSKDEKFDVIITNNLLEHVIDPSETMDKATALLAEGGVIVIQVPNDFSAYQQFLLENEYIEHPFWIAYPDHLNYFTCESLNAFLETKDLDCKKVISDFPIDWFLINSNSNYVNNRNLGKEAHQSRITLENFLATIDPNKLINLYESLADIGMGRQIIGFYQKK